MFYLEFLQEGNSINIQIDGNEPMEKAIEKYFLNTDEEISLHFFYIMEHK